MIRFIASDIDGTLVQDGNSELNPEYYDVIMKLKEKDIIFVAASGRQYPSIVKLFEPIKDDMIFIAENGAFIKCRGEEMYHNAIGKDKVHELIHDIRNIPDCEICLSGKYVLYIESKNEKFINLLVHEYKNEVSIVPDLLAVEEDFLKVSIFTFNNAEVDAGPIIFPKWQDQFEIVSAGTYWLDIMNKNVNKGEAIKQIQRQLSFTKEETMIFGDNINDISMLQEAEESYAIGNAREEVKAVAKHIADKNINHGVLQVLKTLL